MRSSEELLGEILKRSEIVKEKRSLKRHILADAAAGVLCLALLMIVCSNLPGFAPASQDVEMQQYGSLLMASPYIGYIVVSLLAFALGICVTLLFIFLRRLKQEKS